PLRDLVRVEADDAAPVEHDVARVRPEDARDQVEERRLAGPVRADHADDLALANLQVELADHAQAAERLAHAVQLEQRRALAHTISTRAVPRRPCGRAFISATRSAPSRIRRVAPAVWATRRFSHAIAARQSGGRSSGAQVMTIAPSATPARLPVPPRITTA